MGPVIFEVNNLKKFRLRFPYLIKFKTCSFLSQNSFCYKIVNPSKNELLLFTAPIIIIVVYHVYSSYSLDHFDEYEKHFTVMNCKKDADVHEVSGQRDRQWLIQSRDHFRARYGDILPSFCQISPTFDQREIYYPIIFLDISIKRYIGGLFS